ncbi:MAG: M20/M25/M40 family metallo-hydrolase [Halanaerobiales bacterium]|nr:M20/M25/M40 family metallo-hydrolase [Halanaerobiales bacterium]
MRNKVDIKKRSKKIYQLTKELVEIESISNTKQVKKIGDYIYDKISYWPYYQKHPDHLLKIPLKGDSLKRFNLVCLIKGKKGNNKNTVVYLSHLDTVDINDYGELKEFATSPDLLINKLKNINLGNTINQELKSGEWMIGRGTADMKTGLALELELLKEFSEDLQNLEGNILVLVTVNEEADSLGALNIARPLNKLAQKEDLSYIGGINTDYTTREKFDKSSNRYLYLGSIGKLMPAVYLSGIGSHIGDVFEGIDVNLILSELTTRINYNLELADKYKNHISNPPISLKQSDLKSEYNGQLAYQGFAYYNFMNYNRDATEVINIFKEEVKDSIRTSLDWIEGNFRGYSSYHKDKKKLSLEFECYTYQQLIELLEESYKKEVINQKIEQVIIKERKKGVNDYRIISLQIVKKLWELTNIKKAAAIIFFVPPYYPAQNPQYNDEKTLRFNNLIKTIVKSKKNTEYNIKIKDFFPYLSDASFTAFQGDINEQKTLKSNMPFWSKGWEIDFEAVNKLNLPIINMGTYGKDAHKYLERVHIPYSMEVLPELIKEVTVELLQKY